MMLQPRTSARRLAVGAAVFSLVSAVTSVRADTWTWKNKNGGTWDAWVPNGQIFDPFDPRSSGGFYNWNPHTNLPAGDATVVFPSFVENGQFLPYTVDLNGIRQVTSAHLDSHGLLTLHNGVLRVDSGSLYSGFGTSLAAPHTISAEVQLRQAPAVIGVNTDHYLAITGILSGRGLDKQGLGTLTLTNSRDHVDVVTISEGTLQLAGATLDPEDAPIAQFNPFRLNRGAKLSVTQSTEVIRGVMAINPGAAEGPQSQIEVTAGATFRTPRVDGVNSVILTGGGTLSTDAMNLSSAVPTDRYIAVREGSTLETASLGFSRLSLGGGTLRALGTIISPEGVLVGQGTNTIHTNGFDVHVAGSLTKVGVDPVTVVKLGPGTLSIDGYLALAAGNPLQVQGGVVQSTLLYLGELRLVGGTFRAAASEAANTSVTVTGGGVLEVPGGNTLTLTGPGLSGFGQFFKTGTGTLQVVTTGGTFNGNIEVTAGRLELNATNAPPARYLSVSPGAVAALRRPSQLDPAGHMYTQGRLELHSDLGPGPQDPTTLIGLDGGTLHAINSVNTGPTRNVFLAEAGGVIDVNASRVARVPGSVGGPGGLTKSGPGVLELQAHNTYAGNTTVAAGTLVLTKPADATRAALAPGGRVEVRSGATLTLGGDPGTNNVLGFGGPTPAIAGITLRSGGTLFTTAGTTHNLGLLLLAGGWVHGNTVTAAGFGNYTLNSTVTADATAGDSQITAPGGVGLRGPISFDVSAGSGRLLVPATLSDEPGVAGALVKDGPGTMVLSAANRYTGGTVVGSGTLLANNPVAGTSATGPGDVRVKTDGTLGGSGTVAGFVTNGGTVAPGNSAGVLTVGAYEQAADGRLRLEVAGRNPGGEYDQLHVLTRAELHGTLRVEITGGYAPAWGEQFDNVMTWAAREGEFDRHEVAGGPASFGFVPEYGEEALKLTYARRGDANIDGRVDGTDFALLAGNFGMRGVNWGRGDFDLDGDVDGSDFALLAGSFGLTSGDAGRSLDAADWAALESFGAGLGVSVPEPSAVMTPFLAGAVGLLRRRRRLARRELIS